MLAVFPIGEVLKAFAYLALGVLFAIIFVKWLFGKPLGKQIPIGTSYRSSASAVLGLISQAVGIASLSLYLLDVTGAWRPVWHTFGLSQSVFPDLNGTWKGEIFSNGRQLDYKDICIPRGADTATCATCSSSDPRFACYPVEMIVSMTLFKADVDLILCNFRSRSRAVSLKSREGTYPAELRYQFEVEERPYPCESTKFNGAAIIKVTGKLMEGTYWTDRNWEERRQTAGSVTLVPK